MDSFTQIALGIAIAEVCAGKKLKNKTILYGSILGTIPDLDVVLVSFRSCKCSPDSPRHKSLRSFFFFIPLLVGLFQNWKKQD
jgi:membrane-bound metal-dependent hydrolase YbcI (DUF457 family)